jgi:hypothetical protein
VKTKLIASILLLRSMHALWLSCTAQNIRLVSACTRDDLHRIWSGP